MPTTLPAHHAGSVLLGDASIYRMAFGTMRLPGPEVWGDPADPAEARRVLQRAVELGVNYFDTAAYYGPLVSDRLLVEALYPYPENLIIGTKVGGWRGSDKRWTSEPLPQQLRATVEDSLQRLKLDALHLVHFRYIVQAGVPFADSLGALVALRQEGKIRHLGLSGVTLDQIQEAQRMVPIVSIQNQYNLVDRRDDPIVDFCTEQQIPFMPFFPLAVGSLGKEVGPLQAIAQSHQATAAQVALAWLLARSPQMVLIPGTGSVAHLEENIAAATINLSEEEQHALATSPDIAAIHSFRVD